ncbi:MAG: hypothetical protein IPM56_12345 [Ignavibacteriales bacterium]|nr:MAG: hypothetical protein IPM56_12345 [Ignavibacteriales bacterium]
MNLKFLIITALVIFSFNTISNAHCDSVEGPVIKAAQKSLETGNVNYVLIWIPEKDEPEIRRLFNKVLQNRNLNNDVNNLLTNYFFETVVRLHRMGEGVAYTGIKDATFKPEPGISEADNAIVLGSLGEISSSLPDEKYAELEEYFSEVIKKKNYNTDDLQAGRDYVKSYVHFIHYVEELFTDSKNKSTHCH